MIGRKIPNTKEEPHLMIVCLFVFYYYLLPLDLRINSANVIISQ